MNDKMESEFEVRQEDGLLNRGMWVRDPPLQICENCGKEIIVKYGSGRFCSNSCKQSFVGKKGREIAHKKGHVAWNKGKTKETDSRIKKASETFKKRMLKGLIKPGFLGKQLSDEQKVKLSESMKRAHKEGRAWNIGKSRWNNEPSYPEKFFMRIIQNEFFDKNYKREFPCDIYSIDFAWPHKMKCIEIDGDQHQRFQEYIERDKRKDEKLKQEGWKILRISWKDFYKDTKKWIKKSNQFIGY